MLGVLRLSSDEAAEAVGTTTLIGSLNVPPSNDRALFLIKLKNGLSLGSSSRVSLR